MLLKRSFWKGLLLVVVAALVLEATSLIQYISSQRAMARQATERAEIQLESTKNHIMDVIDQAEAAVRNSIWVAQWCLENVDSLPRVCWRMVADNPVLVGSTVALVPGYDSSHPLHSPYCYREGEDIVTRSLATQEYDYPSQEWFVRPIQYDSGYWSEPYVDLGGGEVLMTTYSVPVKDLEGTTAAVLTGDISLEWLYDTVADIDVYPNATNFLISRAGRIITSPSGGLDVGDTILGLLGDIRQKGNTSFKLDGEEYFAYYAPIERLGWSMCFIIPNDDIFGDIRKTTFFVKLLQLLGLVMLALIMRSLIRSQAKYKDLDERKEKMGRELQIASDIQMAMIPKDTNSITERKDLDIAASIDPAKEVGGDLYDYYLRGGRLFFCIGDVSGKGIPASLVMAMTRSVFRTLSTHEDSPARIVSAMNDSMAEFNESNMFVTLFCGSLDLTTGHLRYCNAGHNPPFVLTDSIRLMDVEPNLPLGVVMGVDYKEQECNLHYDDALLLYTDGLTEAENEAHEQFGVERVKASLSGRKSAVDHLKTIKGKLSDFVGNAPQSDDLTMLFLHFLGEEASSRLSMTNDIRQLDRLPGWLESVASGTGLDPMTLTNINLALEEAVTNVMLYAYPEGETGAVDLEAEKKADCLEFTLTDSGTPFDPTAAPDVDTEAPVEDRSIGGLGIHLVRQIMDGLRYERRDGKNIFTMTKNI